MKQFIKYPNAVFASDSASSTDKMYYVLKLLDALGLKYEGKNSV